MHDANNANGLGRLLPFTPVTAVSALLILILVGIATLTVACAGEGAKYVGVWQRTDKYSKVVISISKEGDNSYRVVTQEFRRIEGPTQWAVQQETSEPATLYDGQLKLAPAYIGDEGIVHVTSTQHLLFRGGEFVRANEH